MTARKPAQLKSVGGPGASRKAKDKRLRDADPAALHPSDPLAISRYVYRQMGGYIRPLICAGGHWCEHNGASYEPRTENEIEARIVQVFDEGSDEGVKAEERIPFKPKMKLVREVREIMAADHYVRSAPEPFWISDGSYASNHMVFANGYIDFSDPTRAALEKPTQQLFSTGNTGYEWSQTAEDCETWLTFLDSSLPDEESQRTLQEWFGYMLTTETGHQKILMMPGPPGAGKGIVARIMTAMVGKHRVAYPSLNRLGSEFGLASLTDKTLAIFSDVRQSRQTDEARQLEFMLSATGEDTVSIPRKFKEDWSGQLRARFVIVCNEMLKINDASGALMRRLLIVPFPKSFAGQEDQTLTARCLEELPGIAQWALEGLRRLHRRGRFEQPAVGKEMMDEFHRLGSPVSAFVADCAQVAPGAEVRVSELYQAWCDWCQQQGRRPSSQQNFGKELRAAYPALTVQQSRFESGVRSRVYNGIRLV